MPNHNLRRALMAALLCAVAPAALRAQSSNTGSIRGGVTDASGASLDEVLITLNETASGVTRSSFSARTGRFSFDALPLGEYNVRFERIGFGIREITGIPVRPGRTVQLDIRLQAAEAGAVAVQTEAFVRGVLGSGRAGVVEWLPGSLLQALPFRNDQAGDFFRLSSSVDGSGAVEGLPGWLGTVVMDGIPFRTASHPLVRTSPAFSNAVTRNGTQWAEIMLAPADAEFNAGSGATLRIHSTAGGREFAGDARASWSGSAISKPGSFDAAGLSYNDIRGAFSLAGPVLGDSARASFGVNFRSAKVPVSARVNATDATRAIASALNDAGASDAGAALDPVAVEDNAVSAFGFVEWRVARDHALEATFRAASASASSFLDSDFIVAPPTSGSDLLAGGTLRSRLGGNLANTLSLSFTGSSRETAAEALVRPTIVASEGISFGGQQGVSRAQESTIRVFDAMDFDGGAHRFRLGGEVDLTSYEYGLTDRDAGQFLFGGAEQIAAGTGIFARASGRVPVATWNAPRLALFVQDTWQGGNGLEITVGVRAEQDVTHADDIADDIQWRALTGVSSGAAPDAAFRIAPRLGVTWDVNADHRWLIDAVASVTQDRADPLLVARWLTDDGSGNVERGAGQVAGFPNDPVASVSGRSLSLIAPGFRGPQTSRLGGGIAHTLGTNARIEISGAFRETKFLPRVTNVNLFPGALFRDDFGRAVYGELIQQGALVAADPGSNRRFESYDEVGAIQSDGTSRYFGVTLGIERAAATGVYGIARYTFSRTTDNWVNAALTGYGQVAPSPTGAADEWADGTSDFDTPHRLVAGGGMRFGGLDLAALYRLQSGRPFTPGFRDGVDMNADGIAGNDAAFVSNAIAGTNAAVAAWSCLGSQVNQFAERNSCRGGLVHTVDVKLGYTLRFGGVSPTLSLEIFDALGMERERPDAALYLVDPAGTLSTDAGSVSVPLVLNPEFGQPIAQPRTGRQVRLGVSLNW